MGVDAFGLEKRMGKNVTTVGTQNEANRIEWIRKELEKIPKGSRILDAGAGEQQFNKFCSHLEYIAQDFGKYDGSGDSRGLQMGTWNQTGLDIVSNIVNIPEPDGSFDAILCTEVFEHLPEPIEAIEEFSRLLKHSGILILTAPFCSLTHFSPYHFYTGFNRYFFEAHLTNFEFDILKIEKNGNYFEYLAQELRRIPNTAERYSGERLNLIEKFAMKILLKTLDRFSKKDKGSDELLCFGIHLLAKKK